MQYVLNSFQKFIAFCRCNNLFNFFICTKQFSIHACGKHYVQIDLASMHALNVTYEQRFGIHALANVMYTTILHSCVIHAGTERYIQNGLASMPAPDVTYKGVWLPCMHQTLRTQRFAIHASSMRAPDVTYKTVWHPYASSIRA